MTNTRRNRLAATRSGARPAGALRSASRLNGVLVTFAVLIASAPAAAQPPELTRRAKGDLAIQARAILRKYCHECHGGPASRSSLAVLDHPALVASGPNPVPFVARGNAAGSQILQFIEDGSMPPGGRPRPTPEEVSTLKAWVAATAPNYPAAFDDQGTLAAMLADLDRQKPADRPYLRYLSLAHLVRDDVPLPNLGQHEGGIKKALLASGVLKDLEPVDDTATLFRLDLRAVGWDNRELFIRLSNNAPAGLHPLDPFDLILLEYPHSSPVPPAGPLTARLADYLKHANLVRPIPFVRADWFTGKLAPNTPLAADLKSLGELAAALRKQGDPALGKEDKVPCGSASRAFGGRNPIPKSDDPSPPTAWYAGDGEPDPPPFKLTAEIVNAKRETIKAVAPKEPFQIRVTADRPLRFVLLMVWADGSVRIQPTNKGGLLEAGETFLTPNQGGAFRITEVLTGEPGATEYFVLLAAPTEVPFPTFVRSRHAAADACDNKRLPVTRFVFDADAKFDPARVVRRVIPVTVGDKKVD